MPDPVAGRGLERVAQGVAEVERHPDARSCRAHRAGPAALGQGAPLDELEQLRATAATGAAPVPAPDSSSASSASSPIRPYLTASARAARRSSSGFVGHERHVEDGRRRLVDRAQQVPADAGQVDPALAADRGVDEPERGHRHGDQRARRAARPPPRRSRPRAARRRRARPADRRAPAAAGEPTEQRLLLRRGAWPARRRGAPRRRPARRLRRGRPSLPPPRGARLRGGGEDDAAPGGQPLQDVLEARTRGSRRRARSARRGCPRAGRASLVRAGARGSGSIAAMVVGDRARGVDADAGGVVRRERRRGDRSMNVRRSPCDRRCPGDAGRPQPLDEVVGSGRRARCTWRPRYSRVADRRVGDDAIGGDDRAQARPRCPGVASARRPAIASAADSGSPVRSMKRALVPFGERSADDSGAGSGGTDQHDFHRHVNYAAPPRRARLARRRGWPLTADSFRNIGWRPAVRDA